MNAVNNLVGAIWVGVKNLEVAIDPNHDSTAISDFARNVRNIEKTSAAGQLTVGTINTPRFVFKNACQRPFLPKMPTVPTASKC